MNAILTQKSTILPYITSNKINRNQNKVRTLS